ncbi:hypothetical protein GALMADRAFT_146882 [Galerina marginata CBS 339.88]|uniref:NACHT domain-containing protein n=1 Tax=Galerina marginata (strain CBS 339.88) TaxID=685588 RepID=A0A067SAJ9_GALM3|nr:hypothetical protein GALMADRAFT_146882 [Galerina marginata CBS 339.88]
MPYSPYSLQRDLHHFLRPSFLCAYKFATFCPILVVPAVRIIQMNKQKPEESGSRISKRSHVPNLGATSADSSARSQVSAYQTMGHTFIGPFIGCTVGGNNNSNEILNASCDHQLQAIGRELRVIKDNKLEEKIRKWLSPPDSSKTCNEADEKRQVDTCSWFLEGGRFRDWEARPGFLWVQGKPGTGKTILCSAIINKLSEKNGLFGIAYFFFDRRDSQRDLQLHDKLMRSLIWQFSHQLDGIPTELANLYECTGDHHQPLVSQLQKVLLNILGGFPHVYIVIDALDECNSSNIERTLGWVKELVSDTPRKVKNLHMLVTSRPESDIEKVFEALDSHSIDVGEATSNQDIVKEIESVLTERADGSFRWVALQLAELGKCLSEDEIMRQMKDLPKGLDGIYRRMLKAIDGKYCTDAMTFLEWLLFSSRPMKVAEIADTITVDFSSQDQPAFKQSKRYRNPWDMLKRCSGLVTKSEGKYCFVKLSHFSVKEYLLSGHQKDFTISKEAAHLKIAKISVAYLLQFDSFEPLTRTSLRSSPLAQYAAKDWINHTIFGRMDPTLLTLILQLFTSETAPLTNWIRIYDIDGNKELSMDNARVHPPLYYASLAGLEEVSKHLVKNQADVNAQGGKHGTPLQAVSSRGHNTIVKLLLENGADAKARGRLNSKALKVASSRGHGMIVKLLLANGADVNAVVMDDVSDVTIQKLLQDAKEHQSLLMQF